LILTNLYSLRIFRLPRKMGSSHSTEKSPAKRSASESSPIKTPPKISEPEDVEVPSKTTASESSPIKTPPKISEPEDVEVPAKSSASDRSPMKTPPKISEPEDVEVPTTNEVKKNSGLSYDAVLSPAVKAGPKCSSRPTSPVTAETIEKKLSAAEERRLSMDSLRLQNITARLAKIEVAQQKKEELATEKSIKTKEVLENKFKTVEEKREAQLQEMKSKMSVHMGKIEKAQKELEKQMEEARVAAESALSEKMNKAEKNKDEHLEGIIKKIKEHQACISNVRDNQEEKLKPYVAELETNINKKMEEAEKRRVEAQAKVVEIAKKETTDKIISARTKKEELAALEASKAEAELKEKLKKAEELKEKQEAEMREKLAEKNRKAEIVRKNKEKLQAEGGSQTTESA